MAAGYQHAFAAKYVNVTAMIKDVAVAKSDRTISFLLEKQQRTYIYICIYYCSVKSKSSERVLSLNLHILEVFHASFKVSAFTKIYLFCSTAFISRIACNLSDNAIFK